MSLEQPTLWTTQENILYYHQMDITLNHPSGDIELFPIEENTTIDALKEYLKGTYKCFDLVSNGVNIEDTSTCFSTLEIPEVTVVSIDICDECSSNNERATWFAARYGHLDCLKYLHENGCPWKENATWSAASNGHLDCLKYLHENECPWDKDVTWSAAWNGHLDCLMYLHENGCPWKENVTLSAALNSHLDCLKYLQENGCP